MLLFTKDSRDLRDETVVEEAELYVVAITSSSEIGCAVGSFVRSAVGDSVY